MESEQLVVAPENQVIAALGSIKAEILAHASRGLFHCVIPAQTLEDPKIRDNVVGQLKSAGFRAAFKKSRGLRVEWGRSVARNKYRLADLRPEAGESSVTVDEVLQSSLCRKVPRAAKPSKFFDPALTVLTPEAVLERAKAAAAAPPTIVVAPSAVARGLERLRADETQQKLSRLSTAASAVEAETALGVLDDVINSQRQVDDTKHNISSLLNEIDTSASGATEDPLAALSTEIARGPTHRQLREVEALIDEVDMAATPNTRRKKQEERNAMRRKAAAGASGTAAAAEKDDGKLQLAPETLQRVSQAQLMAKETFDKEQRRLEKEEQRKLEEGDRAEKERQELVRAAEQAEKEAEESAKSMFLQQQKQLKEEEDRLQREAEKRRQQEENALREAAERRRREEESRALKQAALDAEAHQARQREEERKEQERQRREKEEREALELRAELELKQREEERRIREQEEKQAAAIAAKNTELEAAARKLQEEREKDLAAKVQAAKLEVAKRNEAVEQARRSAAAPQLVVPDVAFTPINPAKGGAGTDLETPATAFVYKDDLNIESMLGDLNFDLDTTTTRAAAPATTTAAATTAANKAVDRLKTPAAEKATGSRDSVRRELEGFDDLMGIQGLDAFSFDTTAVAPNTNAKPVEPVTPNDGSRTGGLNLKAPVTKAEDIDVDAALNFDLGIPDANTTPSSAAKKLERDFSTVVPHDTAKEVVAAAAPALPNPNLPVPTSEKSVANLFENFEIETLDTKGATVSASALDVQVNLDAIGASPLKAEEEKRLAAEKKAADDKLAAEKKAADERRIAAERAAEEAKNKAAAEVKKEAIVTENPGSASELAAKFGNVEKKDQKVSQEKRVDVVEKGAEVKQDEASKAGFGSKKAMFEAATKVEEKPKPKQGGGGGGKKNKKKGGRK